MPPIRLRTRRVLYIFVAPFRETFFCEQTFLFNDPKYNCHIAREEPSKQHGQFVDGPCIRQRQNLDESDISYKAAMAASLEQCLKRVSKQDRAAILGGGSTVDALSAVEVVVFLWSYLKMKIRTSRSEFHEKYRLK